MSFDPDSTFNKLLRVFTDAFLLMLVCVAILVLIGFIESL